MTYEFNYVTVERVYDADTIYVTIDLGMGVFKHGQPVRVSGVDAPELNTPEGKDARDFVANLLTKGRAIKLVSHGWDKYGGRIDCDVYFGADRALSLAEALYVSGHVKDKA